MKGTNKIIINTIILYVKIFVCMAISLWTVPIVLHNLGDGDFGLYNLVAGVIAMLAFLNGAMTVSTQRYLSVTIGVRNEDKLLDVYNLSFVLHIILGVAIALFIEMSMPLLFNHVLTIPSDRIATATLLFHYLVISLLFTILTVPFDAVLNAYENMGAFSIFGIIESLLRLAIALTLPFIVSDKLNFYGFAIMGASIFVFFMKYLYVKKRYSNLYFSRAHSKNKALLYEMSCFAGWNTLSSIAIIGRNQGIALVLNHFFGIVINTAYGIGNQINGVLGYFSQTIQKSINPQLMESQGTRDIQKMRTMSMELTKFSTLSIGILAIPLFIEMPYILELWLRKVPEHTISFARYIIIMSFIFQLSSGLMSAIQSSGKIKWYTISIFLMMVSIIPLSYYSINHGGSAETALQIACIIEVFAFCIRLYFAHNLANIPVSIYLSNAIIPLITTHATTYAVIYAIHAIMSESMIRLAVVFTADIILFSFLSYRIVFSAEERYNTKQIIKSALCRISRK